MVIRQTYYCTLPVHYLPYLDFGPPVPLGAMDDEKSPSLTVTGDPAGSMPADTDLFQVFFECTLPCFLRPPPIYSAVFWHLVLCCTGGSFSLQSKGVASHFLSPCCNNVLESHYLRWDLSFQKVQMIIELINVSYVCSAQSDKILLMSEFRYSLA